MSLMRIAYIIGFLGLVFVLLLQFVALPEQDSGLSSEPDKALTIDQASSDTDGDVFYKLAPPARSTGVEAGRSGSVVNKRH